MNILFLSHSDNLGGAERCLYLLVRALADSRFDVAVIVPGYGPLHGQFARLEVPTRQAPLVWWAGSGEQEEQRRREFVLGLEERVSRIERICREQRIDLVVSNTSVIVEGALAAAKCGLPHIWHLHEMHRFDPTMRSLIPLDTLYWAIDQLSDRVVGDSQSVIDELAPPVPTSKTQVIHNGVPLHNEDDFACSKEQQFGLSQDTPVVCFVGRLSERKGVMDLLPAAARVIDEFPNAQFIVVGGDHDRADDFREAVTQSGLSSHFRMMGQRSDFLDMVAASDLLVVPSRVDPMPLIVLDAMSVGAPVVATRSGGCSEMVVDGETGFLVPVKDPQRLAESICDILRSPELRTRMSDQTRRRQQQCFSEAAFAQQFVDLFEQFTERKPSEQRREVYSQVIQQVLRAADPAGTHRAEKQQAWLRSAILRACTPLLQLRRRIRDKWVSMRACRQDDPHQLK